MPSNHLPHRPPTPYPLFKSSSSLSTSASTSSLRPSGPRLVALFDHPRHICPPLLRHLALLATGASPPEHELASICHLDPATQLMRRLQPSDVPKARSKHWVRERDLPRGRRHWRLVSHTLMPPTTQPAVVLRYLVPVGTKRSERYRWLEEYMAGEARALVAAAGEGEGAVGYALRLREAVEGAMCAGCGRWVGMGEGEGEGEGDER
ncbi:hypothetical protein MMC13_008322 [Lambiella insularis]|nr:hypothetical protein [Lambiella insularis]